MKFDYGFCNEASEPTGEKVRLVIEVQAKYADALAVLDAARVAYSDIEDPVLAELKKRLWNGRP